MRWIHLARALAVVVAGALSLSACGKSGSETYFLFGPARMATSELFEQDANNYDSRGLASDAMVAATTDGGTDMIVGWEHYDDTSVYWYLMSYLFRGAVKFNIGLLSEGAPKSVTKAVLSFRVKAFDTGRFLTSPMRLYLGAIDWVGWPEFDLYQLNSGTIPIAAYPYPPYSTTPLGGHLLGTKVDVDVTEVVRDWKNGVRPNRGFVFTASPEVTGLYFDNDREWQILGDFTLKVTYK